jgi:hypothetical protein
MCPFCLATAAILAGSTAGTGGVTALAGTILLKKSPSKVPTQTDEKEVPNGGNSNTGQKS